VIQAGSPVVVHAQPDAVVTDSDPVPPAGDALTVPGVTVKEQGDPGCVTVNVRPAIVAVPVRCDGVVLAATASDALPLPEPLAPPAIVIQLALLAAVQAHPDVVVTATVVVSPPAGDVRAVGEIA
jgi:hypothetical protein